MTLLKEIQKESGNRDVKMWRAVNTPSGYLACQGCQGKENNKFGLT